MKKIVLIAFLFSVVYACSRKIMPVGKKELNAVEQEANLNALSKGSYIYQMKCGQCHAPKSVAHYTNQQWAGILAEMIPKAKLNTKEKEQLILFIQANAKG
jgi:hypothetical protein